MNKNKIILFLISLFALTACSSINEYLPSFLTEGSTPAAVSYTHLKHTTVFKYSTVCRISQE